MANGPDPRETRIRGFLERFGWADASRTPFPGDASTRRYERLRRKGDTLILMDAPVLESPPCPEAADEEERLALGWNAVARLAASRVEAFVAVSDHLRRLGFSAPAVIACDIGGGLALIEDLGDTLFARVIEAGGDETLLYAEAARTLARIHADAPPPRLDFPGGRWPVLAYDRLALGANLDLFIEWTPRRDLDFRLTETARLRWERVREALIDAAMELPRALILRDTHAENLLWLPQRDGIARVGLLDFQDAVLGWAEWDMSMLLHDARRDVSVAAADAASLAYLDASGGSKGDFDRRLSLLGAMNIIRIIGIFSRLAVRDGKTRYDSFQPRLRRLLRQTLGHSDLAEARAFISAVAPHLIEADR
jgi:hypothetical protein